MDAGEGALVTAASLIMQVEIIAYKDGRVEGILRSKYLDTPFRFVSLLQIIAKMEEIFDAKGFPQSYTAPRTFGVSKDKSKKPEVDGYDDMKDSTAPKVQNISSDSKCTFEITVKFRQNATWQGQILWAEKNLKQNFRSDLEMLKLMDEAINEVFDRPDPVRWSDE